MGAMGYYRPPTVGVASPPTREHGSDLKTNVEWEEWGRLDPLYGVATWPGKDRKGQAPWTDSEFYSVGERDWAEFAERWQRYGLARGSCLEIGCGAGRITRWLADSFDRVIAVDVSSDMIEYAKLHVSSAVEFHVVDGTTLPVDEHSVDSVFSVLVFQHFEQVSDAKDYLREVARVIVPNGTIMIQFPTYAWPGDFFGYRMLYRLRRLAALMRAAVRRQFLRWGRGQLFFRFLRFESGWLETTLSDLGFGDIELVTFLPDAHPEWLTFAFARKRPVDGSKRADDTSV